MMAKTGWLPAAKPGEKERTCERCGKAYVPAARTQKYCPACRKEARR